MTRSRTFARIVVPILLAGLIVAFFAFGLNRYLTLQSLRENDRILRGFAAQHPLLAPAAYVVIYAGAVALSVPGGAVMTIAGGLAFGLWRGAMLAILGATAGAVLVFLLARFVFGDVLEARAGPFLKRMAAGFERNAFSYLLFLRLVPAFPFWAVNLAPALLGVQIRSFAAATLIGIVPGTLAYASVGDSLGLYFAAGSRTRLSDVFSPEMTALRAGLALLALLPVAVQWIRKRHR